MHKLIFTSLVVIITLTFTFAQQSTISGIVQSSDNQPLVGANIQILDSDISTVSNSNGAFIIRTATDGTKDLQISYLGYTTKIVQYDPRNTDSLNIQLTQNVYGFTGITVSAQKREEQVKDVPITMSVINEESLSYLNLQKLDNLICPVLGSLK